MAAISSKRVLGAILLVVLVAAVVGASARGTGHTTRDTGPARPTMLTQTAHDTSAPLARTSRGPISMRIHAPMLPEWRERVQTAAAPTNDPAIQASAPTG